MPARSLKVLAAAALAVGALAGCGGTPKVGTAAVVGGDRITVRTLDQTVRDWRAQFRKDPVANELRSNSPNPPPQLGGDSDSDLRGALTALINFRVAERMADKAGATVNGADVDQAVWRLKQNGGAESNTLARGLPRAYTRDFARFLATRDAVLRKLGGDPANPLSPATQLAGQRGNELALTTANGMDIEINQRYGEFDPKKLELGPVEYRLSSPDSGI